MRDHKPFSAKSKARAGFLPADAAREAEAAQVPGLQARIAAANVIADVAQGGHLLDERFSPQAVPFRLAGMESRDVALARSIAYVGVRRLGAIRHALALLLEKGLPKQAARLEWPLVAAAAQILFLEVPDHAAVDLAVRAVRLEPKTAPFAGLVNGVLRNLIRRREEFLAADPLDLDTPAWLAQRWTKSYGEAQARAIAAIHMQEPPIDLSVKADAEGWARRLDGVALPTGSVRLRTRTPIVELEGFAQGEWWVQDAAAALPARLLAIQPEERVLDMCAAPGGKTAQLALARAQVTALDRSAERLKLLAANLQRLGLHADIAVGDAATYSAARPFDAILLDAPCSATGTIRRHPDVPWIKKPGDLDSLVALQSRILERAAGLLRPEGRLVYCTCSLEPEEGEAQIAGFLRRHPEMRRAPIDASADGVPAEFVTPEGDLRTLPSYWPNEDKRLAGLDGFFAARLVRRG
ncbi:methyltransferase domain-containing protein [Methylosinus sporium]|uniref:Methyltransferase domain-containing protein n=1 Tax=Methylosinus sporium TaxID=428 RepID=A0A549T441_METSR|nr:MULTISPECIES: transcription antitermination factor NusB [Methylosinus]MBU3889201.1 methyltransferase domain-containing protein [Methylosinus sp. KRF6]TRL36669.1 methyltransferase domain-containing protein [Methylosinus sporium]